MTSPFSISGSNRKIDPTRRRATGLKADGSPDDNDRVEIGPTQLAFDEWAAAGLEAPHLDTMRAFRLNRLVAEIRKRDLGGLLMFDPLNIRYATDTTNMQLWITHNAARACFVSADGYIILWDFHNCEHLSAHLPFVRELRGGASFFYFETGDRTNEHAKHFASEIADIMQQHAPGNKRLAVDKIEIAGLRALDDLGFTVTDGQEVTELARAIKGPDEIKAMRCAVHSCEMAVGEMHRTLKSGLTENDVWAVLHAENIRRGGEWIETRILSSGPRTNPWFQESGPRVIQHGDILAFDTDLIGVYGMCCDISRTWMTDNVEPNAEQKHLYQVAHEHIRYNMELLKPGMSFNELTEKAHRLPEEFREQRYGVVYHGVGLCDEYPSIRYPEDLEGHGYDGVLEPGMMLCVEAYIGAVGGQYGVKLEDQVLITENGYENLTRYPFEEAFLK
ncbi:dimethylsulfonioproprionate lyase DddP [Kiloniella sp. b19]|uniref:dimethylsulfonioproprionate lyase DddP n=1 Tax=Kiloniella sp. GXU_MW_B19 TaxID=3141326 RepID=UPI0031D8132F